MFIVDYFVFTIYYTTRNFFYPALSYFLFPLLVFLNIDSVLLFHGYPIWENAYGNISNVAMLIFIGPFYFIYEKKGRLNKIYEKYKDDSKFKKVLGWIYVGGLFIVTIFFMAYPKE
jgi:hypothetical protein